MTYVFIADALSSTRTALGLLLQDLKMQVVGTANDWATTLSVLPTIEADMLIIDWNLLPSLSQTALAELRVSCPKLVIVIISHLDAREQVVRALGADVFISKTETPERVAERLRGAAERARSR